MIKFVLWFHILFRSSLAQDDCQNYKLWAEGAKLSYGDFKMKKDTTNLIAFGTTNAAITSIKIDVCLDIWEGGKVKFEVINKMVKNILGNFK